MIIIESKLYDAEWMYPASQLQRVVVDKRGIRVTFLLGDSTLYTYRIQGANRGEVQRAVVCASKGKTVRLRGVEE